MDINLKNRVLYMILLLALLLRLYHIDFPVSGIQGWRQADTAAIAKNFYENGFSFLYPQIDWGGNTPGYVETEFPIYQFAVAILYKLFFSSDMWGRLLSVICSLVAIGGLYHLVKKILGEPVALLSAFLYAILPLNVFYSRAFMPESFMLLCSILGVYYFSEWMETGRLSKGIFSVLFISLAALTKIVALYLGLPLLFLALDKYGKQAIWKWQFWVFALAVVSAVSLWYYHAHQVYEESGITFGIWETRYGKWGTLDPLFSLEFYQNVFLEKIMGRHLTYGGFILFIAGLFVKRGSSRERLFDWWLIGALIYIVIVAKGNLMHEHYQLPLMIPAVVFIAKSINTFLGAGSFLKTWQERKPLAIVLLLCVIALPVQGFLRYTYCMGKESRQENLFKLGDAVQSLTQKNDLIVAVDSHDPVILYRCNRKGWHVTPDELTEEFLKQRKLEGAHYLIGMIYYFDDEKNMEKLGDLFTTLKVVERGEGYFILEM